MEKYINRSPSHPPIESPTQNQEQTNINTFNNFRTMLRLIRIEHPNRDVYEGWWSDQHGCPHGPGTYMWANGVRYEGSWKQGRKHGYGVQTYPNGDKYDGGWKEGQWHGYGELTRREQGRKYQGGFAAGQEHGYAVIRRENALDGRHYEGGIRQGQRHGYGNLTTPVGTMEGGFKFDRQDGWQEIRAPMRHDYSGTYREGKMWGVGRLNEYATGKVYDGVWDNNEYRGPLRT